MEVIEVIVSERVCKMVPFGKKYSLKLITLLVTALFLFSVFPVFALAAEKKTDSDIEAQVAKQISDIGKKYGVIVSYKDAPKKKGITFSTKVTPKQVKTELEAIEKVLSLYPEGFCKTMKLKNIYIVKSLSSGKYSADGVSMASMFGPKLRESIMYLNVPSGNGAEYTFHHELMHIMEYAYPSNRKAWLKIVGGSEDELYWENASGNLSEFANRAGFVSNYAGYSVMEDRAETYAVMMAAPYTEKTRKRFAQDQVLKEKFEFIVDYCKTVFPNETSFLNDVQAAYDAIYSPTNVKKAS